MSNVIGDIITVFDGGVRIPVRAKPGLSHTRKARLVDIGDGQQAIEITVAAEAREGKANKAIVERIAEDLDLKKSAVVLKSGARGRLKLVEISGDPVLLRTRIQLWLSE